MNNFDIWLLAIGLAMDCTTVSMTSGIIQKKIVWRSILRMAFFFGLFQAIMPLIGWLSTNYFNRQIESFDHWIAFFLLALVGGKMLKDAFSKEEECNSFNPNSIKVIITLAIATSIDALAIGISFSCLGMNTISYILYPIAVIGFVSFVLSIAGNILGVFFGSKINLRAELLGGIVLLAIGIKILIQHLN